MTFEYYDKIKPDLIKKAEHMYAKYVNMHDELLAERQRRTARVEYSRDKRHDLRLGYYCPNPLKDLVIGNVKRGRILKRKSSFASADIIFFFDENNELIGAEEKLSASIIQHYIINEDGYSLVLSFKNTREIYGSDSDTIYEMALWYKEDGKISLYIDVDTDSYTDASGFGVLARMDVWLFSYCQDIPVEFEWFYECLYPEEHLALLKPNDREPKPDSTYNFMKEHLGQVNRHIYRFDHKTEEGLSRYNIYRCWSNVGEPELSNYQDIAL